MRNGVAYYRDFYLRPPVERVPPELLEPTWPRPVTFPDPRRPRKRVEIIGICDVDSSYCNASALANGWDLGPRGLFLEPKDPRISDQVRHFANAEAAFLALQFWSLAQNFQDLSPGKAWQLKKHLEGSEDWTYSGYEDAWNAMAAVLAAKFAPESKCAEILLGTGDAFLLQQGQSLDRTWSNNGAKKDGKNWIGMLLMFLRDELRSLAVEPRPVPAATSWTDFLRDECCIDPSSGEPRSITGADTWRKAIQAATTALMDQAPR